MEKISFKDLTFQYPLGERKALDHISFSIEESDFVVLCGKSGCGKSTLLRHMKKHMTPYGQRSGGVYYDGIAIEDLPDRKDAAEIGFVQQNPDNQVVTDKVWHELAFGLENLGLPNVVIKRRVAEMASYFGIDSWFRKNVSDLSGGQKQLLNLASVMAMQPKVIVLDEPTSQLDPIAASDFLNTVYKINRDLGTTVIISEHRLEEVFPMADKVIVLDNGSVLTYGEPETVGLKLYRYTEEAPHPMYYGMPAAMRAFPAEKINGESLPLTVRGGRLLLENLIQKKQEENPETVIEKTATLAEEPVKTAKVKKEKQAEKQAVIQMKDLFFRYEKNEKDVLRGLNLSIYKNEIFTLLGGNGSGKSTTLHTTIGILKPQRGKLWLDPACHIALVPQNPQALFTEITVEEELYEGMIGMDLTDAQKVEKVGEMLKLMEIEHLHAANPYDLSGGEQQRLAIGKVMVYAPEILLLDEPTKGLDPFFKRTLGKILREIRDKGVTIFMVSHDIDFCAEYSDRSGLFFDGEVAAVDESHNFFCGNGYYTTTTNKIVREWRSDIILCEEAKEWMRELL